MFEMRSFSWFVFNNLRALFQIGKFVPRSPFSPAASFSIDWFIWWNITSENPCPAPHKGKTWQSCYCECVKGQKWSSLFHDFWVESVHVFCFLESSRQCVCYFVLSSLVLFLFLKNALAFSGVPLTSSILGADTPRPYKERSVRGRQLAMV